jgi:hypothetical protein
MLTEQNGDFRLRLVVKTPGDGWKVLPPIYFASFEAAEEAYIKYRDHQFGSTDTGIKKSMESLGEGEIFDRNEKLVATILNNGHTIKEENNEMNFGT